MAFHRNLCPLKEKGLCLTPFIGLKNGSWARLFPRVTGAEKCSLQNNASTSVINVIFVQKSLFPENLPWLKTLIHLASDYCTSNKIRHFLYVRRWHYARISIFGGESIIVCHFKAWTHIPCHQNKQFFPGFVSKPHNIWGFWRALAEPDSRRQTQGGHPSHTHPHTHSSHTRWAWETWAQRQQLDCTMLLTALFLWATGQVGFEGKTNTSTVPLAFSPHFLKETVFWAVWCLWHLPAVQQTHTMASWRSKQERQSDSSLLREKQSPLTLRSPPSESPRDSCSLIFLLHRGQSEYLPWFKTPSSMSSSSLKSMKASTWARHCATKKGIHRHQNVKYSQFKTASSKPWTLENKIKIHIFFFLHS